MTVTYLQLQHELERILLSLSLSKEKAVLCSTLFANNSRDGFISHGLNRFPVFVEYIKSGMIDPQAEPECVHKTGALETWDGHLGLGTYNATLCMNQAIALAKENGIGCVALRNTNHWMRGGTYGWQAAEEGCIGICFTNAIAGMPPWGGMTATLGNNPLIIAVPRKEGPLVLDMAMSQFSYGKIQEYQLRGEELPMAGGYDEQGRLTSNPKAIQKSQRALPIGSWKGAGLALMLDILVTSLSGGWSTAQISKNEKEIGVSQCFICIQPQDFHALLIEEIILFTKTSKSVEGHSGISYPGERTLLRRKQSESEGITVNKNIWETILKM